MLLFCLPLSSLIILRGYQQQQAETVGMQWLGIESNTKINQKKAINIDSESKFYRDYSLLKGNNPQNSRKSLTQESGGWSPIFPIPR